MHYLKKSHNGNNYLLLLPSFGIAAFILLYVFATFFYPGGSQADKNASEFSWLHNYWCNLLMETAINGQHNISRPIALAALAILCASLALFWYIFPQTTGVSKTKKITIQLSGTISMAISIFLFTGFHDVVIIIASMFGLIALAGTFYLLYKMQWKLLFGIGLFNLPLIALNNILYYGGMLFYLPVVQKISFLSFLCWVGMINIQMYRRTQNMPVILGKTNHKHQSADGRSTV